MIRIFHLQEVRNLIQNLYVACSTMDGRIDGLDAMVNMTRLDRCAMGKRSEMLGIREVS
jgi:hypothetical protein